MPEYKKVKGSGSMEKSDKKHSADTRGDFGHGANEMYSVSTDSEKEGLKSTFSYKPGNMGYPSEAFDYEY